MDKKIAGLLGAAAALTAINTTTQATPARNTELAPATTYRDLLNPVPNALSALKAFPGSSSTTRTTRAATRFAADTGKSTAPTVKPLAPKPENAPRIAP
jgi:hypothetical protein